MAQDPCENISNLHDAAKYDVFPTKGRRKFALFSIISCVLLWGFSFISIKESLPVFPPMTLGAVRFVIAIVVLFLMYRFSTEWQGLNKGVLKSDLPLLIGSGFAGVTFYFFFENNGVMRVTASEASIITAAIPVLTMIADWLVTKSSFKTKLADGNMSHDNTPRLGWQSWLGAFISIAGVAFVAGVSFSISGSISGYIYMGGAALCWVGYSLLTRPLFDRKRSRLYIVFWQNFFGFLGLLPFAMLEYKNWGNPTLPVMLHVIFLALGCSAIGYWLYAHAMEVLGVSTTSVFINLIPVVTVIAGFIVLHERLTLLQGAGAVLVLAGVYLTILPQRDKRL
jgi:drug/metabolite transporter (DMT)-like permease